MYQSWNLDKPPELVSHGTLDFRSSLPLRFPSLSVWLLFLAKIMANNNFEIYILYSMISSTMYNFAQAICKNEKDNTVFRSQLPESECPQSM